MLQQQNGQSADANFDNSGQSAASLVIGLTFVAAFLGNPPINFLEGTVSTGDAGAVFTRGDIALALLDPRIRLGAGSEK